MNLRELGNFRSERTEDFGQCPFDGTYCEIVRVKGSKPEPPCFKIPSHLYKYSETDLALYLKDHKNYWRPLGKLLNEDIDITDEEIVLVFPVGMFSKVAEIVPFVKKRGSGIQSDAFKAARKQTQFKKKHGGIIEQTGQNYVITEPGQPIRPNMRGGVRN